MVIPFPRDRCRRSSGKIRGGRCTVVILPTVRTELPPTKPTKRPARKRTKP